MSIDSIDKITGDLVWDGHVSSLDSSLTHFEPAETRRARKMVKITLGASSQDIEEEEEDFWAKINPANLVPTGPQNSGGKV